MAYTALPDRRMPYDNDGSVVAYGSASSVSLAFTYGLGVAGYLSGSDRIELNDGDYSALSVALGMSTLVWFPIWLFFPERREVSALYMGTSNDSNTLNETTLGLADVEGSVDSTNGVDGTWEVASLPSGRGQSVRSIDGWRANIKPVSFTGGKSSIRLAARNNTGTSSFAFNVVCLHVYGEKVAGQTPDDLIFIDHDTTPGVEYTAPEDFGDRPLGTTVTRQFRVKNASATLTANSINLQCNDTDFAISTDGTTWVTTINISSLAAGAESATMYIRDTTPAAGNLLGPRFARIIAIVGSWS